MKHRLLFSCLLCYLTACTPIVHDNYPHRHYADITTEFLSSVSKTYQFIPFAIGTMWADVKVIVIEVIKQDLLTVDETRILFVSKVEQLLEMINRHEAIRPYLQDYPADTKYIQFGIKFRTKDISIPDAPYVGYAYIRKGKIYYTSGEMMDLMYVEPYEKALQLVKENAPWALEKNASDAISEPVSKAGSCDWGN